MRVGKVERSGRLVYLGGGVSRLWAGDVSGLPMKPILSLTSSFTARRYSQGPLGPETILDPKYQALLCSMKLVGIASQSNGMVTFVW
jgi:hypothetical protein